MAVPNIRPANNGRPHANRMTLGSITKGPLARPIRLLIYGIGGVGKTSFASKAPAPIFVGEAGSDLMDVERFPMVETWQDVLDACETLLRDEHSYKTLVLDTVDDLELKLWRVIAERQGVRTVQDIGYGKGHDNALEEWRVLINLVERLWIKRNMNVILTGHCQTKPFKNPAGEDYDRYQLKINDKAAGFLKGWCDVVLFAEEETFTKQDSKKRVRGVSSGARIIHTVTEAAWDAKARAGMPRTLPLEWADFFESYQANEPASPTRLRTQIERLIPQVNEKTQALVHATLAKVGDNVGELARVLNKLTAQISIENRENEALEGHE